MVITPELLARMVKARDALREATERLNEAWENASDGFAERIGLAKGRVMFAPYTFLGYLDGEFYVLKRVPDKLTEQVSIFNASRDTRMRAVSALPALWKTLGGPPL